jgi:diaminopimelate epimerase
MGRARLRSETDFPSGGDDGQGDLTAAGREFRFQFVQVGNPQCSIEAGDELEELEIRRYGPEIEHSELFPNRTNVSFWRRAGDGRIRARIFERGVGETLASGTGATGAAVAAVLRGVDSPVTVELDGGELEVEVGEDMHMSLTGWALPVYSGTLSEEFAKEIDEVE